MAHNMHSPPLSPPYSEDDLVGDKITSFATLSNGSTPIVGFFPNTNNSDKPSPLLPPTSPSPTPSSPSLVTPSELDVLFHEPDEQMQPQPAGKPRGRPPGSKNKPKPAMNHRHQPMLLTVPAGMDIVNAIIDATHNQDVTVMVYHAMGSISEATICNPLDRSRDFFFQGNLFMWSFSGFYSKSFSPSHTPYSFFTARVSRAGTPNIFGGRVRGKLIAAKPLQIMVFFIKNIEYYKAMTPFIDPNVTKPYCNNPTN